MFDCIPFFNELDLLEIRLNVLDPVIERFVIVESTRTYSGIPKPLFFADNDHRFKKFWPKIIHLVHEGQPTDINDGILTPVERTWRNENSQRNLILKSLEYDRPSDDLFLLADTDEIPKPEKLLEAKDLALKTKEPVGLSLLCSYYWYNYVMLNGPRSRAAYVFNPYTLEKFHETKFNTDMNSPSMVRWHMVAPGYDSDFHTIHDAGWHLSSMGGIDKLKEKLESFGHHSHLDPSLKETDYLIRCLVKGQHFYAPELANYKCELSNIDFLPKYIQDNAEKYKKYIL